MYELITDVPVAIAEFYTEDVRNEPTGEMVEESFPYLEDGVEQTGTRMVPEYIDNTYVIQVKRPQMVSWDKVNQIIEKHQGKRDDVISKFIDLAMETEKWEFFDEYKKYLEKVAEIELYNTTEQLDEEGNQMAFEPKELPEEPVLSVTTLAQWKLDNYDVLRKAAYLRTEKQLEMQVDGVWQEHIAAVKAKYPKA